MTRMYVYAIIYIIKDYTILHDILGNRIPLGSVVKIPMQSNNNKNILYQTLAVRLETPCVHLHPMAYQQLISSSSYPWRSVQRLVQRHQGSCPSDFVRIHSKYDDDIVIPVVGLLVTLFDCSLVM